MKRLAVTFVCSAFALVAIAVSPGRLVFGDERLAAATAVADKCER
jgi:hypothetical protein